MRKLAAGALAYSAAIFAACYIGQTERLILAAAVCCVLAPLALFFSGNMRKRLLIILLCAAVGFGWSAGYGLIVERSLKPLTGQTVSIRARIVEYPDIEDSYQRVNIRLIGSDSPHMRVLLYSYDKQLDELEPGDEVYITIELKDSSILRGEDFAGYTSRGVFLLGYLKGEIKAEGEWKYSFLYFPQKLARELGNIANIIFPSDVSGVMNALLTGERGGMSDELYDDMSIAGLLHVVCISGMHVAFLISFISLLTGNRVRTAVLGIFIIIIFIPMTGAGPAVIRASFMQTLLLLAPLVRRENDSITSLSAVLAILLTINPASSESVSLQLSFASMAGVILFSPGMALRLNALLKRLKIRRRSVAGYISSFIVSGFSSSVGAAAFSVPLVAVYFGYMSLYSILTNVLCIWAVSLCFILGFLACVLFVIFPSAASVIGLCVAWPARFILYVVGVIAGWPYAAIYTYNDLAAWWMIFVYLVFAAAYIFRRSKGFRPGLPILLSLLTLFCVFAATWYQTKNEKGSFAVLDVGQGQCIVVMTESSTVVIDCGSSGNSNAAVAAAQEYIGSFGRRSIDLLVLTHFHADHANGAAKLISRIKTERLMCPVEDYDDDDDSIMAKTLEAAKINGTDVDLIEEDSVGIQGGVTLMVFAPLASENANENGLMIIVDFGDWEALITGDVNAATERKLVRHTELPDGELLVVGHHGSKTSTSPDILEALKPETAVISVGYNTYGHPTEEVILRLFSYGITTYRTDRIGTVRIEVD